MDTLTPLTPPVRSRDVAAVLALCTLLGSFGTSSANVALPRLGAAFSAPFAQVQLVVVAYLVGLTLSVYLAGRLGDRFGLRPALLAGLMLFASGAVLCGLSSSLALLIAARTLQGAGAAFLITLSMALMRDTSDDRRIGRAMGLLGTMSALGTASGPALGGLLLTWTGWRGVFLVQAPLAVAALLLAAAWLPRRAVSARATATVLTAGAGKGLAALLSVNLLVAAVMMATLVVGPFVLGRGLGLTEPQVGFVMSVGPVISILGGMPSGHLVDAWGSRRVMALGLWLLAGGAVLLAVLPGWIGVAGYLLAMAALTPGYQLFQAANNTASLADVPAERRGAVSGLVGLSRNLGLVTGTAVLGSLFAFAAGTPDLGQAESAALTGALAPTFGLTAVLLVLAIARVLGARLPGRAEAHS